MKDKEDVYCSPQFKCFFEREINITASRETPSCTAKKTFERSLHKR